VLFRPEEVHRASGTGSILEPLPERYSHIADHILGFYLQNDSIPDLHVYGLSAIEAGGIDANRFAGKKPADRQRFEPSLAEPFLLTINCNAILGGKVVKRGKGGNEIRIGKEPTGNPGSKKLMERLPPLLYRDTQFGCNLYIMGRLPSLYHSLHNDVECPVKTARFSHRLTSCLLGTRITPSFINI
jgi:hypothetical protein